MQYALDLINLETERVFRDYMATWPEGLACSREAHVYYVWSRLLYDAVGWDIRPQYCGYCWGTH